MPAPTAQGQRAAQVEGYGWVDRNQERIHVPVSSAYRQVQADRGASPVPAAPPAPEGQTPEGTPRKARRPRRHPSHPLTPHRVPQKIATPCPRSVPLTRALGLLVTLVSGAALALPGGRTVPESLREADVTPPAMQGVDVVEHLGEKVPLDVELLDVEGRQVTLGQLLPGDKPVILTLVYYNCPMLCNLVLNGLVKSLQDVSLEIGRDFHLVTVSIDPKDTPHQSLQRRRKHLQSLNQPEDCALALPHRQRGRGPAPRRRGGLQVQLRPRHQAVRAPRGGHGPRPRTAR